MNFYFGKHIIQAESFEEAINKVVDKVLPNLNSSLTNRIKNMQPSDFAQNIENQENKMLRNRVSDLLIVLTTVLTNKQLNTKIPALDNKTVREITLYQRNP